MNLKDWLEVSVYKLEKIGIPTARLDCLVLLEDVLRIDRANLIAHPETKLSIANLKVLNTQLIKRLDHQPLSYIRGKTEFYGREFIINKHVLEPRPESEAMIEFFKELKLPPSSVILDIGTGSGALAITAKLERSKFEVLASDIDEKCLAVARQNAKKHGASIKFIKTDLFISLNKKVDVILANLPYVPDEFKLNEAAKNEPKLAIFGGPDGLDIYRRLFEQLNNSKSPPKFILTESLPTQHSKLAQTAKQAGFKLNKTDDFIQLFSSN